jgi:hypothetical protein
MRIIFSAVKKEAQLEWLMQLGARSFLFSYEDKKVIKQVEFLATIKDVKLLIVIDSGAFSAWNRGLKIDIDHYVEFIDKVKKIDMIHELYFINLDVIPHTKGTIPTGTQIKTACEKGIENWHYIKSKGHSTIHTFHQFEDLSYLKLIMNECNDLNYIGISPANDQSLDSRSEWLKDVYSVVRDTTRTHLLGLTAKGALEKFPAFSADSSSWLNVSKYGELFDYEELEKIAKRSLDKNNLLYYDPKGTHINAFKYYLNLEKHITNLWNSKGIKWE